MSAASDALFLDVSFWENVIDVDEWLDADVAARYGREPLAQDWARVAKAIEELGEAVGEMILWTGQNPRKGTDPEAKARMLDEMADVSLTAILGIQHFTKDSETTRGIVVRRMTRIWNRMSGD